MVSVLPEAVASITLDWSGPTTEDVLAAAVDRVREILHRILCGGEFVNVVLGSAARVHSGREADGVHRGPAPRDDLARANRLRGRDPHAAVHGVHNRLRARRRERHRDICGDLIGGLRHAGSQWQRNGCAVDDQHERVVHRRLDQERSRRVRPADGRATVRQRVVERDRDAGDGGNVADLLQLVRVVCLVNRVVREVHRVPDLQLQLAGHRIEIGCVQVDGPVGRGDRLRQVVELAPRNAVVLRVAEHHDDVVEAQLCLLARRLDAHAGGRLASGHHGGVREEFHLVDLTRPALAAHERHGVPGDGGVLGGVQPHRAIERVVVIDIELQRQAGEVRPRQVLLAQVIEVVIGVVEAQDREVFGGLEDAGDGHTCRGRIVDRGRRAAPGEALQLEVAARIEDPEGFGSH